mmetsp:Transcript_40240/g.106558  ORF Transcript_40240/g.106558 Transcript_40240/m.106558 type:complete len:565 (-) Transcript_40240:156-1850(-)
MGLQPAFTLAFFAVGVHAQSFCSVQNISADDAPCHGYECLKAYVDKPDANYAWEDTGQRLYGQHPKIAGGNWTGYVINMTSQAWLKESDFDFSWCGNKPIGHIWWHILVVIVPSTLRQDNNGTSFLYMTGGNNDKDNPVPSADSEDLLLTAYVALSTGAVGAALFQVPNQHLVFSADKLKQRRQEDAVIAFTWYMYVQDPVSTASEWPLRLPMTKAGVRAMDTITSFLAKQFPDMAPVNHFGVAGASKRGWTTWTVASVDKRVVAAMPVVMDELNFVPNIHHHYRSYGGWSFALADYTALNVTACIDHPNTLALMKIVDPYWYSEHLKMSKLIINSGMDEFFLPDDTHWWWDDMPGPKHFLMVPNAEHSEATGILEIVPNIATYLNSLIDHGFDASAALPNFEQTTDPATGAITVKVFPTGPSGAGPAAASLKAVHLWHATTCNNERRDFRIVNQAGWGAEGKCTPCGFGAQGVCTNLKVFWSKETLQEKTPGSGVYVGAKSPPSGGRWAAFFVDVVWEQKQHNGLGWPVLPPGDFEFTSQVSVVPNIYPFEDCHGADCQGTLV